MELSIRSIVTVLLVTFTCTLPLNQAHAHYMSYGDNNNDSRADLKKDFDGSDWKSEFNRNYGFDRDDEFDRNHQFVKKFNFDFSKNYKEGGFDGRCEQEESCGNYKERYCYCDGGKCDDGNHNVPEPTPLALLGLGIGVIGLVRRFAPSCRK
jgi:PEP-CTERM motif